MRKKGANTVSGMKAELHAALAVERDRKNVNDSKFRAVEQRMDYDGFRQMVLGANLKCVKKGEYQAITDNAINSVYNSHAAGT
jgi:hypothetical protein